jgi:hypothetical protein
MDHTPAGVIDESADLAENRPGFLKRVAEVVASALIRERERYEKVVDSTKAYAHEVVESALTRFAADLRPVLEKRILRGIARAVDAARYDLLPVKADIVALRRDFCAIQKDPGPQGPPGPPGPPGPQGDVGPMPRHRWRGTALQFEQPRDDGKSEWGEAVDLQGPAGKPGRTTIVGGGGSTSRPGWYGGF